ncbi:MAG TPA: DNA recombination protein RmuC [Candidatus Baltobacteraceae bacterium]|nr:DNA recombination protein RmuC [Candidatus Baltobacteraceae bacterium]
MGASELGLLIAGIVLGAAAGWLWAGSRHAGRTRELETRVAAQEGTAAALQTELARGREEIGKLQGELRLLGAEKAEAEVRARLAKASLDEQQKLFEDAKAQLTSAFQALAADALRSSNEGFLQLAEQRFQALQQHSTGELDARKTAVETLIRPLQQALDVYQKEARELEEKRLREISSVGQRLGEVAQAQTALQRETANLVNALRAPQVRGRWGEVALRKTVELAGMTKYCDFVEQESVAAPGGGRLRPDMVIRLPAKREIVVDAKVALHAYLEAIEAPTGEQREAALVRHAQQVRQHVKRLASKEYWSQFPQAPDFVVLFIPGEVFFGAAAERDPDLLQDALANQVLIATPTTFIGLLLTAHYGWRQEQVAENAQRISELGRQVYERLGVLLDHLGQMGKALEKSVEAYNKTVGSLESRVLPAARRFLELDSGAGKPLPEPEPIPQVPRVLGGPDGPVPRNG